MDTLNIQEEIEDLLFSIDVNKDLLTDEKTKYLAYCQYYYNKLLSVMNNSNRAYLYVKINNLVFSTNQLMYEADVEQRFWIELEKLMKDPNFVYIFDDIYEEIETLLIIFSEHAMYRYDYTNEYQEAFNEYMKNGIYLDDSYYLSDVSRQEYIDLLNKYNKKLSKAKK